MSVVADVVEYNDAGIGLDEDGNIVLDDTGNEFIDPDFEAVETEEEAEARVKEEEAEAARIKKEEEEAGPTPEEIKAENEKLKKENSGLKEDTIGSRRKAAELQKKLDEKDNLPRKTQEEIDLENEEPITKADLDKALSAQEKKAADDRTKESQKKLEDRDKAEMEEARKDEKFAEIERMATEVMDEDPALAAGWKKAKSLPVFFKKIAKLHPDYVNEEVKTVRKKVVEKLKKNASKPSSGAGINSKAPKGDDEDHDSLTLDDLDKMTPAKLNALPDSVKDRILMEDENG